MTYFITYDLETGEHGPGGSCAPHDLLNQCRDGVGVIEVLRDPMGPIEATVPGLNGEPTPVILYGVDPEAAREALLHVVDLTAGVAHGNVGSKFPGLAEIHAAKAAEARAYKGKPDVVAFPLLTAEAAVRDISIEELRKAVLAKANAAALAHSVIEGKRIAAKLAVAAAGNVGAMVAASTVDWEVAQ